MLTELEHILSDDTSCILAAIQHPTALMNCDSNLNIQHAYTPRCMNKESCNCTLQFNTSAYNIIQKLANRGLTSSLSCKQTSLTKCLHLTRTRIETPQAFHSFIRSGFVCVFLRILPRGHALAYKFSPCGVPSVVLMIGAH